jgi:alkylated DNA repair dioxygenase AlkB
MAQKTFKEKSFTSTVDNLNVQYKRDFLTPEKADKYYQILENLMKVISDENKRICVTYGNKQTCEYFTDTKSWDGNDIVCQILRVMKHFVEEFTGLKFNFVLINRYPDGHTGMGKHRDKELCLGDTPTIAGISLGSVRDIQFEPYNSIPQEIDKKIVLSLDHGSVYVMHHPTNKYWTHEILKNTKVNKSRISLTFRYVYDVGDKEKAAY